MAWQCCEEGAWHSCGNESVLLIWEILGMWQIFVSRGLMLFREAVSCSLCHRDTMCVYINIHIYLYRCYCKGVSTFL